MNQKAKTRLDRFGDLGSGRRSHSIGNWPFVIFDHFDDGNCNRIGGYFLLINSYSTQLRSYVLLGAGVSVVGIESSAIDVGNNSFGTSVVASMGVRLGSPKICPWDIIKIELAI